MVTNETKNQDNSNDMRGMLVTTAAALLGAAAGSKLADATVGGKGLPSFLAQCGGAILGAVAGKTIADVFYTDSKS